MTRKRAYQLSLLFNSFIFIMELFVISNRFLGFIPYTDETYTILQYQDLYMHADIYANILLGISCLCMAVREIYYLMNMRDYRRCIDFFIIFKLCAVVLSMIVFLAAYGYFLPFVYKSDYVVHLFDFHYTLWAISILPLFGLVSFIFFDRDPKVKLVKFLYIWIPIVVYFGIVILLVFTKVITAPYEFFDTSKLKSETDSNLGIFIGSIAVITAGSYGLGVLILLARNVFARRTELADEDRVNAKTGGIPQELLDHTTADEARAERLLQKAKKEEEKKNKKGGKKTADIEQNPDDKDANNKKTDKKSKKNKKSKKVETADENKENSNNEAVANA